MSSGSAVAVAALALAGCTAALDFDVASLPSADASSRADVVAPADVVVAPADVVVAPADVVTPRDAGGCGLCPSGLSCVNGACVCPAGLLDCGDARAPRCRPCCRHSDCDDGDGCTTDRCENDRCVRSGCEGGRVCCRGACMTRCG